ncbi:RNA polymerase sigma factor [Ktedonobacter robiniae]|uniref:DNA-directed RNA polymerase sigma-70 factor n=1 Tax=Ktedonobacter robiniae TaxID=2778365 RepID=A0ABQ3UU38_9CHLR|nr:sigma-70 family RNA polymerase sigma factor [Ktedonobacter robiniae]GHO56354.1 DNA-directed RNA polymerase sigma-70 factor [Ktedonobacter robiniae]
MNERLVSSAEGLSVKDDEENEVVWIEAARENPAAFEPLYVRYRTRLYRYLRTRLTSDEDAADVTHQVFLIALDALPKYQQCGLPFAAWLFRIAHHTVININRRQRSVVSWDALPDTLQPLDDQNPESLALHQEALMQLRMWLAKLKADQRELLALRFAAELTVPQIAAVVGKKPEATKKQLSRLLQSYKELRSHAY